MGRRCPLECARRAGVCVLNRLFSPINRREPPTPACAPHFAALHGANAYGGQISRNARLACAFSSALTRQIHALFHAALTPALASPTQPQPTQQAPTLARCSSCPATFRTSSARPRRMPPPRCVCFWLFLFGVTWSAVLNHHAPNTLLMTCFSSIGVCEVSGRGWCGDHPLRRRRAPSRHINTHTKTNKNNKKR